MHRRRSIWNKVLRNTASASGIPSKGSIALGYLNQILWYFYDWNSLRKNSLEISYLQVCLWSTTVARRANTTLAVLMFYQTKAKVDLAVLMFCQTESESGSCRTEVLPNRKRKWILPYWCSAKQKVKVDLAVLRCYQTESESGSCCTDVLANRKWKWILPYWCFTKQKVKVDLAVLIILPNRKQKWILPEGRWILPYWYSSKQKVKVVLACRLIL